MQQSLRENTPRMVQSCLYMQAVSNLPIYTRVSWPGEGEPAGVASPHRVTGCLPEGALPS